VLDICMIQVTHSLERSRQIALGKKPRASENDFLKRILQIDIGGGQNLGCDTSC